MAKKAVHSDLKNMFDELKEFKNIDYSTMVGIIDEAFRKVIAASQGTDKNYKIIINPDRGDFEIWRTRVVVDDEELEDDTQEIALSEALKIADDYEVGEEVEEQVDVNSFGRRAILNLAQILSAKITDVQKDSLYTKYSQLVGHIISAEVYQVWKKEILLLDDNNNELLMPKTEQIPSDFFKKGEIIRAVVLRVDNNNNNPKIYLSRTNPEFLRRLLEREVPEIQDGLITIKNIVRMPGEKAKIAVESYDDRIDAVGACVGVRGSRIQPIIRELNKENIDVINYTSNPSLYIARALAPAKVTSIILDQENKRANVYINPEDISLAIGKNGANIKLAIQLTGYHIEVIRGDAEIDGEDIYLEEFSDEIDQWIIDQLKGIGCDTAKQVLKMSREELIERADLEEETVDHVINVLKAEFEE